jgi:flavin reductase (DIM6/NTAB) family NADH-FMN oxidoreductase RutF
MHKTTFDTGTLSSLDRYKLLIGLVVPRPIGWIGTVDAMERRNLAPYSFFNVVAGTPPTVLFSPGRRSGEEKDSLRAVKETGAFTVNIVTETTAEAMNLTSGDYPPEVDEFDLAGLTAVDGVDVAAPLVAEAAANLECVVTQIVDLADPPTNSVVFGEVRRIHVASDVLDGTRVIPERLAAIGRMAGNGYTRTADGLFSMERPA